MRILIVDNGPLPRIIRQGQWIKSYLGDVQADVVFAIHDQIPSEIEKYSGVILSGGTEPLFSNAPWIVAELKLIEKCAEKNISLLGVCHGHQLIGRALMGDHMARKNHSPEFGWKKIRLVEDDSRLFQEIPSEFYAHCSHFDEVCELPPNFRLLAKSDACKIHAFECKDKPIWGIQFHPEITIAKGRILLILVGISSFNFSAANPKTLWNARDSGIAPKLFGNFIATARAARNAD